MVKLKRNGVVKQKRKKVVKQKRNKTYVLSNIIVSLLFIFTDQTKTELGGQTKRNVHRITKFF